MPLAIKISLTMIWSYVAFTQLGLIEAICVVGSALIFIAADAMQISQAYRAAETHFAEERLEHERLMSNRINAIEKTLEELGIKIRLIVEVMEKQSEKRGK